VRAQEDPTRFCGVLLHGGGGGGRGTVCV
jgi:hypothetical protein